MCPSGRAGGDGGVGAGKHNNSLGIVEEPFPNRPPGRGGAGGVIQGQSWRNS